jgi:hypothetical protein
MRDRQNKIPSEWRQLSGEEQDALLELIRSHASSIDDASGLAIVIQSEITLWTDDLAEIVPRKSAPIKKLPFGLLHEIFWQVHMDIFDPTRLDDLMFGIPIVEQFFPDGRPDGVLAWTLSQVCRTWRELVINSPRLWADVAFLLPRTVD